MNLSKGVVRNVYTFLICFMGLAMPNLNLLMSIGTFLLLIFWLIDPGLKAGLRSLKHNKTALLLIGIILICLIWLINTENFSYAFKDIRIKAPLLVFGVVLGSVRFTKKQIELFFLSLSIGVWVACGVAYYNYFQFGTGVHDYRDIVTGISHIRLSLLMVALAIGIIGLWSSFSRGLKIYYTLVFLNILIFFQLLQSLTGIASLGLILLFSLFVFMNRRFGRRSLIASAGFGLLLALLGSAFLVRTYQSYFTPKEDLSNLKAQTVNGNSYYHQKDVRLVENGHYIFMNICEPELVRAWNARSQQKMNLNDQSSDLRNRLIRYLTGKGYKKDSVGVMSLSEQDIKNIEAGYPGEVYTVKSGLALRLHSVLFAYHVYSNTGYASGYSFFQRMVYWKVALEIAENNFLFGVGTGDVKEAFKSIYTSENYNLDPKYWLRAHNQFLTFLVSFGVFGLTYFIYFFIESFRQNRKHYIAFAITLLAALSCLTEDTLETQAGVAFFGFFMALFSKPEEG